MPEFSLLVSSPPQREEFDALACMEFFGITAGEVRMKARFPAPEIWFMDEGSRIERIHATLTSAGLKCVTLKDRALTQIPAAARINQFIFAEKAMYVTGDSAVEIPYDTVLFAVLCRPAPPPGTVVRTTRRRVRSTSLIGGMSPFGLVGMAIRASKHEAIQAHNDMNKMRDRRDAQPRGVAVPDSLDLYFSRNGELQRLTIYDTADFSGLGNQLQAIRDANMEALCDQMLNRFSNLILDTRLDDLTLRSGLISGVIQSKMLEQLTPSLKDISLADLASRLIFRANCPWHGAQAPQPG